MNVHLDVCGKAYIAHTVNHVIIGMQDVSSYGEHNYDNSHIKKRIHSS